MSVMLRGIPASRGVAIGMCLLFDATPAVVPQDSIAPEAAAGEWARLQLALQAASAEIGQLHAHVQASLGKEEAAIFEAHQMFLEDEELLDSARLRIEHDLQNAAWAFWDATEEFVQLLAGLKDSYLQARAADIQDIRARIINRLLGRSMVQLHHLSQPAIIAARDLGASDIAEMDRTLVLGLVTEQGGPTSHSAILARRAGLPTVVATPGLLDALQAGENVLMAIDGGTGDVVINPTEEIVHKYQALMVSQRQQQEQLQTQSSLPAITRDGVTIAMGANIGSAEDASAALAAGAEGVGLFRTEFLFLKRTTPPDEEEQFVAYHSVLQTFAGKAVIVRTLDIGGDKHVPYLELPREDNPFLGLRGLRLCLASKYQPLFVTQLRALLRAAQENPAALWIMFPMVCDLRELRQAKVLLAETEAALVQEGKLQSGILPDIKVGIMVETPAAALLIDQLAQEADFFSIGTNDLSQYTLAADRMNANLAALHRPFHPAVMRSLAQIIQTARSLQRWVGVCGEMAADPRASAFLLGLGINELSMDAGALNAVKQAIRATTAVQAQALVPRVLAAESSEALEQLLAGS